MVTPTAEPAASGSILAAPTRYAVAGNPNSGKTTLFNALTGLRQRVGNYPGVTVEQREGRCTIGGRPLTLLDLPGTYSLSVRSPDEQIARDVLLGRAVGVEPPDAVIIVIDALNIERNLYLASQTIELGLPAVIACNMMDLAERQGAVVDVDALSRELGVPVIGTIGSRGIGIDQLRKVIAEPPATPATFRRPWRMADTVERAIAAVADAIRTAAVCRSQAADGLALLLLVDAAAGAHADWSDVAASAELRDVIQGELARLRNDGIEDLSAVAVDARYRWIAEVAARCVRRDPTRTATTDTLSDRVDRVLTHRVWGTAIFAALIMLLFVSIFSWAEPLMRLIESAQSWLQRYVHAGLPGGPVADLLADGVIGGAGSVVIFFPQICILFFFIAILEDSGYMARASYLMDGLMSRVGLHGKSFIPLVSSYACAVPGIMATRTIENARDRLTTILVAPLISCSARLPVYLTIISVVFPGSALLKAGVIFGMYALGTLMAMIMAALFKRTILAGPTPAFIMELPPYHIPRPIAILRMMWDRSRLFLTQAGTIIVAICVLLWGLSYFPRNVEARVAAERRTAEVLASAGLTAASMQTPDALPEPLRVQLREIDDELAGAQLRHSFMGRLGHLMEPTLRPLGFDWRVGVGVLASFAAREVFVGTMGVVFNVSQADEESETLRDRMRLARWESGPRAGTPLFTPLSGVSLMVFYVLCCQCVSTLAVARRETNSWRWPAFMFAYMTGLAYLASWATYRIGLLLA